MCVKSDPPYPMGTRSPEQHEILEDIQYGDKASLLGTC